MRTAGGGGTQAIDASYPPTNKPYAVPGVAICRGNALGEIIYHRDYYDLLTLMRQIGIVPPA